jgi:hypothetical protein
MGSSHNRKQQHRHRQRTQLCNSLNALAHGLKSLLDQVRGFANLAIILRKQPLAQVQSQSGNFRQAIDFMQQ